MDRETAQPDPALCERTLFLEAMLADEERGRLADVDFYLSRFPAIAEFVRAEYAALQAAEADPAAAGDEPLPAQLGRYQIRGVLGEGGMGRVLDAFDPELDRRVVVKVVRLELGQQLQARERLQREARVLGQLAHPRLARVLDVFEAAGQTCLVMAFQPGRTLGDLLGAVRSQTGAGPRWLPIGPQPCPPPQALRRLVALFAAAAEALHSAHRAGIVHRDLKPQNLMVAPDGGPVVLDFGLAQPSGEERLTRQGELLGTPLYMAPEQIEGRTVDARSDVYALGVCLYEALTLAHPFAGPGDRTAAFARILRGDPVPPRRHQALVPRDLEAVVLRAVEREPARRYPDMAAFAADLQRVLDLEPTEARPATGWQRVWRHARRRPAVTAMGLLVVLLAALWGRAEWQRRQNLPVAATMKSLAKEMAAGASELARLAAGGGPGETTLPAADAAQKAAALQAKAAAMELTVERLRSAAPQYEGLVALHPRGAVLAPTELCWVGLPVLEPPTALPVLRFTYAYRVQCWRGEQRLGEWRVALGERLGRLSLPADLRLAPGLDYRWSVAVVGCDDVQLAAPERATAADRELLAECRQLPATAWLAKVPERSLAFTPVVAPAPPPAAGDWPALAAAGLWSDLRLRVLTAEPAVAAAAVPWLQQAAAALADRELAAHLAAAAAGGGR